MTDDLGPVQRQLRRRRSSGWVGWARELLRRNHENSQERGRLRQRNWGKFAVLHDGSSLHGLGGRFAVLMDTHTKPPALRILDSVRAIYEVPKDDIASELLVPGMTAAHSVRIMVEFFKSRSFGTRLFDGARASKSAIAAHVADCLVARVSVTADKI